MSSEIQSLEAPSWLPALEVDIPEQARNIDRERKPNGAIQMVNTMTQYGKVIWWGAGASVLFTVLPPTPAAVGSLGLAAFMRYASNSDCKPNTMKEINKTLMKIERTKNLLVINGGVHGNVLPKGQPLRTEIVFKEQNSGSSIPPHSLDAWYELKTHTIKIKQNIPAELLPDAMLFLWASAVQKNRIIATIEQSYEGDVANAKIFIANEIQNLAYAYEQKYFDSFCFKWLWDALKKPDDDHLYEFGICSGGQQLLKFKTTLKRIPLAASEVPYDK